MTHLPHLGTAPQRRRFRALDALDRLVARECEAVTARPPGRTAAAEAPADADAAGDDAFIQGAIAYLSSRPNAAELIAGIERRWQDLRAGRDEPSAENGHVGEGDAEEGAAQSAAGGPAADAATETRPESAP
jgi:hypothetical protein